MKDVLAASASLFARKSYDGTSMTDIARAVGLQRASLYHYFPNKQAIFFELMKRYMFPLYELIRRWEAEGVGGAMAYYRLLRIDLRHMLRAPYGLDVILSVTSHERNALFGAEWTHIGETYARFLDEAIASGECRPIDPILNAALLDAAMVGVMRASTERSVSAISGDPVLGHDVAATVDGFAELALHSVLASADDIDRIRASAIDLDGLDPRLI